MGIRNSKTAQQGVMLLEALIGILIFSTGILALIGMQALSISFMSDAKYRSDASFLANEIVSMMWVDRTNLANYAYPGGTAPALAAWIAKVNDGRLPGSDTNAPTIVTNVLTGEVTVTIRWQPPGSGTVRKYDSMALITNP
ncbi:MAG: pilus assembly protein PilV [Betaproteobacteria bacterium]|nr:pilus assembly protein PilV [Betaproteobacteria bacterium]